MVLVAASTHALLSTFSQDVRHWHQFHEALRQPSSTDIYREFKPAIVTLLSSIRGDARGGFFSSMA